MTYRPDMVLATHRSYTTFQPQSVAHVICDSCSMCCFNSCKVVKEDIVRINKKHE